MNSNRYQRLRMMTHGRKRGDERESERLVNKKKNRHRTSRRRDTNHDNYQISRRKQTKLTDPPMSLHSHTDLSLVIHSSILTFIHSQCIYGRHDTDLFQMFVEGRVTSLQQRMMEIGALQHDRGLSTFPLIFSMPRASNLR